MEQLLFDGAFGTYHYQLTGRDTGEMASLKDPTTVLRIHREYLDAGAQAIKTNTYGVNFNYAGSWEKVEMMLSAALQIARNAAEEKALVYADIGVIPQKLCTEVSAQEQYLYLAKSFLEKDVRHFLFETQEELETMLPALEFLRDSGKTEDVIVSFAVSPDGYSQAGHDYQNLIRAADESGLVQGVGLNCHCGPQHMVRLLEKLPPLKARLSAMPNTGYPSMVGGRMLPNDNTEYFASQMLQLRRLGVCVLGGCCGTTPKHLKKAYELLRTEEPPLKGVQRENQAQEQITVHHSRWQEKLHEAAAGKRKLIAVEVDPPADADDSFQRKAARVFAEAGVDALTVADSPLSRTRADSLSYAARLHRETGSNVIAHLSCRDRNGIAIQGALLSYAMEGCQDILAVTGDPAAGGQKGVFHFHSRALLKFVGSLSASVLAPSPICSGAALNVNAANFSAELQRAQEKEEAGADFFITQPVWDETSIGNLTKAAQTLKAPILAEILPPAGYKNALFLHNEVPGVHLPYSLLEEMRDADAQQATEISLRYCSRLIAAAWPHCAGFHLVMPMRRTKMICRLIDEIRRRECI